MTLPRRENKQWYDLSDSYSIEGGDVLVLSKDIVAVGLSQRTTVSGAETFARNLLQNSGFKKVLAFDIPETRAFMHLDTVFTMVDYDKFTIHPEIEGPLSVYEMMLDEHGELKFAALKDELKDILALELKLPAVDLIRCGGGDLLAAQREQWNDGSNTSASRPGASSPMTATMSPTSCSSRRASTSSPSRPRSFPAAAAARAVCPAPSTATICKRLASFSSGKQVSAAISRRRRLHILSDESARCGIIKRKQ